MDGGLLNRALRWEASLASTPERGGADKGDGAHDLGSLQEITPKATTRGTSSIFRLLKKAALSVIHHPANDGTKFITRKQTDFAFHIRLLLSDDGTIHIVWFSRLG